MFISALYRLLNRFALCFGVYVEVCVVDSTPDGVPADIGLN